MMAVRHAVWRTTLVKVGDGESTRWDPRDWPYACDECPEQTRDRFGCGWDESTRGHGTALHARRRGERFETCPQWLARQPAVCDVYELLDDYKSGRLGDVRDLPHELLVCLRAATDELEVLQAVQQERMIHGG